MLENTLTQVTSMAKFKFVQDYPINASAKILYPYLSSAGGLKQWFCQDVEVDENKIYNFVWDNTNHYAEITGLRTNRSVRFVFLDENKKMPSDPSYIDFQIETSELVQEQYLRIIDYSEDNDVKGLTELWEHLIQNLREIIGG